jgi:hypothetical protein
VAPDLADALPAQVSFAVESPVAEFTDKPPNEADILACAAMARLLAHRVLATADRG